MIFWCLLSRLELLTVCLIVKVYWLMTRCLSTPQKWKDRSIEDLDFRLCILGLRTIKRGCSMKSWGEIKSYTPLQYGWEISAGIMPLEIFWAETPACKGQRLWLWAGDSGQRIRPPKFGFHPSGASLCCLSGVFEKTLRSSGGPRIWERPGLISNTKNYEKNLPSNLLSVKTYISQSIVNMHNLSFDMKHKFNV
jgi:hypothetical protein